MAKTTKKTTTKTKPSTKVTLSPVLDGLARIAKNTTAANKGYRQLLICDAFEELHRGLLWPGKIGDPCTYQACHVAAWAIRNALYPVPGNDATKEQHFTWAESYRQSLERTAAMTDDEKFEEINKGQLKL